MTDTITSLPTELVERVKDHLYNPFEPDNQSRIYLELVKAIAVAKNPDGGEPMPERTQARLAGSDDGLGPMQAIPRAPGDPFAPGPSGPAVSDETGRDADKAFYLWLQSHGGVVLADQQQCFTAGYAAALSAAPVDRHFQKLQALWLALDDGPQPRCRDCADHDGQCPNDDDLPCDPQERALEQIRRLRSAPVAQEPVAQDTAIIALIKQIEECQSVATVTATYFDIGYIDTIKRDAMLSALRKVPPAPAASVGASAEEIARIAGILFDHPAFKFRYISLSARKDASNELAVSLLSRAEGERCPN